MTNKRVGIPIFPAVEVLDFCGPYEVFSVTRLNEERRREDPSPFEVLLVAQSGEPVVATGGLRVIPDATLETCPPLDILVVPGGWGTRKEMSNQRLLTWISERARQVETLTSVCTGAMLLGEAGLLDGRRAPTLAYIHGGYWQMNDKEPYAFLGEGLRVAGFNLVLIEYTLAPAARMDQIVDEVRRAVVWVIDHAPELGGDPARVYVSGHSAGGHLTAMAMTESRLAGAVAISGIYDLEPIRLNYLNEKLGLDPAEAERNSPMRHLPRRAAPLVVTVGLGELPELVRQSQEYAAAWQGRGLRGRYLPVPTHDHFSILEELAQPNGTILEALREMA